MNVTFFSTSLLWSPPSLFISREKKKRYILLHQSPSWKIHGGVVNREGTKKTTTTFRPNTDQLAHDFFVPSSLIIREF